METVDVSDGLTLVLRVLILMKDTEVFWNNMREC